MDQMTGMDASFFYLEEPSTHMHIVGVMVIDPSTMPGGYSFDRIKELYAERLHLLKPFRRRPVFVPFQLDHPVWIEDESFDMDRHFRRVGIPSPGSLHELAEIVGQIASVQLDRSRPLWELTVVEGLEDGNIALVTKMHHSSIDGVSGADLMVHLFDITPTPQPVAPPEEEWKGEPIPSDWSLVSRALLRRATQPARFVRAVTKTLQAVPGVVGTIRSPQNDAALPLTAPRTRLQGSLTPHRNVAFGRADLADFKTIKNAFGTTVNDVVLAACTESLRQYLLAHDDLPDKALVASVPVSVRTEDQQGTFGNRVSAMFAALPVQLEDPVQQLMEINRRMGAAKELHQAIPADILQDWTEAFGPAVLNQASRLYARMKLADRTQPIHNVVISNVPGPPMPLYMAGARMISTYPLGPVLLGAGLNLTVLSNMGNVDFAAVGCTELVPDIWQLADGFAGAVATLKKAAEARA